MLLAPVVVLLASSPAWAHRVRVFASAQGRRVICRGYFPSGAKPRNCPIKVLLPDGTTLVEGKTDDEGRFTFEATVRADLKVILETGPGHRAECSLSADQLPNDLPLPTGTPSRPEPSPGAATGGGEGHPEPASHRHPTVPVTTSPAAVDGGELQGIVREVIRDELLPLREEMMDIRNSLERPRATEIIAAVGYILGIMGIVAYFRYRAPRNRRRGSP